MSIADATLLTDATLELRHILASGCTDPGLCASGSRSASSSYIMTSYPKKPSQFPFIIIQDDNISDERLGAGNEASKVNLTFKVDIFSTKVGYDATGRDRIWNNVYDTLRTNQLGTSPVSGTHLIGLHDFKLLNTWNMDEPGIEGVHRKIARVRYNYYTG